MSHQTGTRHTKEAGGEENLVPLQGEQIPCPYQETGEKTEKSKISGRGL